MPPKLVIFKVTNILKLLFSLYTLKEIKYAIWSTNSDENVMEVQADKFYTLGKNSKTLIKWSNINFFENCKSMLFVWMLALHSTSSRGPWLRRTPPARRGTCCIRGSTYPLDNFRNTSLILANSFSTVVHDRPIAGLLPKCARQQIITGVAVWAVGQLNVGAYGVREVLPQPCLQDPGGVTGYRILLSHLCAFFDIFEYPGP